MKTKRRTEITVETHRTLVIRANRQLEEASRERCGKEAARISLQAAKQAGVSPDAFSRHVEEGRLHFTDSGDSLPFICLVTSTDQERSLLR